MKNSSLYVLIISESSLKHGTKPDVAIRATPIVVESERASIRAVIEIASANEPWFAGYGVTV